MENLIRISWINDFVFCPVSIYYHGLFGNVNKLIYQDTPQILGTESHKTIDKGSYSDKKDILQGIEVYCSQYGLMGKIDIFDVKAGLLRERKKKIVVIYDGYIMQVYAQYHCLKEMGYSVKYLQFYSMDDNKIHPVLMNVTS